MLEATLILIKPDAVDHEHWLPIIHMYEKNGITFHGTRIMSPMPEHVACSLYEEHRGKPFFKGLIAHMTRGVTMAFYAHGDNAITKTRELNGNTSPAKAEPYTIRAMFGTEGPANAVHASENAEAAQRELALFFGKKHR